ncbi:universal stress protein [Polaribacter sp.]|nr:universal stress protein [Polaribacter sp.]
MKNILVPIGATENASNTLQYAIDFASEIQAKIFVFRAYSSPTKAGTIINIDAIIERETNLYIKTMVKTVDAKNVELKMITAKGGVLDSVAAIDEEIGIDLIIVGAKSNSIKEELFLGKTAGSLVKKSNVPVLTIPDGYKYKSIAKVMIASKSGIIESKTALQPLQFIVKRFVATVDVLLVKTASYKEEDTVLNEELAAIQTSVTTSENATTFQGVLEHINAFSPDVLCVFRRNRGFFKKLWEKDTILKKEFYANVPLLVLQGK